MSDIDEESTPRELPVTAAEERIRVGITHGDYNGIGYETVLKAFEEPTMLQLCTPVLYGSAKIASFYRKACGIGPVAMQQIGDAEQARADTLNIINVVGEEAQPEPGTRSRDAGAAALSALERAVADLKAGAIDVLVTAPIDKLTIQSETFTFPGHTEYLGASLGEEPERKEPLMMLCEPRGLRVALVTQHTALEKVAGAVTREAVLGKLRLLERALREDFGIVKPRIAVLALNPHAGEGGLLGREEMAEIGPAITDAQGEGISAYGPYSADGFFGAGEHRKFDAVLAMYHDQGLIPFKTLAMDAGVNFTAGLPWVRTSPDHGTAYDIAGQGKASAQATREAIYMAIDIYRSRQASAERTSDPLPHLYVTRAERPDRAPRNRD